MERDAAIPLRWRAAPLGEAAILFEAQPATLLSNRSAVALASALENAAVPGIFSAVPGISSLLVRFDPLIISQARVVERLARLLEGLDLSGDEEGPVVTIPVHYGGQVGPDLQAVAEHTGLTPREVVAAHCAEVYRVLVIGFAPGFPYIGPLPSVLNVPRLAPPRPAVPAGSVALAAGLTGIYPARLPGGWRLLGHTTLRLFDSHAPRPALLAPGDRIRFEPLPGGVMP